MTALTWMGGIGDPTGLGGLDPTGAVATGPATLALDPGDDAIGGAMDRDVTAAGGLLLSWTAAHATYVRAYDAGGAPLAPPTVLAHGYAEPCPGCTRVLALGTRALVGVGVAEPTAQAFLVPLDAAATASGPPRTIGDGQVVGLGMQRVGDRVLLAWTERVAAGGSRLMIQQRALDASPASAATEVRRLASIGRPDVVATPSGALLVYVGTSTTDPGTTTLYGQPVFYAP